MKSFMLYPKIKNIALLISVVSVYATAQADLGDFDTSSKMVVHSNMSTMSTQMSSRSTNPISDISIGNYIWYDYNQNGIQDLGELGLYGVSLNLYDSSDCSGSAIATTKSSDMGYYKFDNLSIAKEYCVGVVYPSYWKRTSSNSGDDKLDSDIVDMSSTMGKIENITPSSSTYTLDGGLYHKDKACQMPTLKVGAIGKYNHSKTWAKRASLDVKFNNLVASGYCHEYHNSGPQTDERYSVHLKDRLGFSDEQRDKLSRVFRFMSDHEVMDLIEQTFDKSSKHIWFVVVTNSFVWYYSDWDKNFQNIESYIENSSWSSNLSDSEKEGLKKVSRVIIDKIDSGEYNPMKVYYLWNEDNDKNQDIIVPKTLVVPDREACTEGSDPLKKVTIGDKLWLDSNYNGIQDSGESGYSQPVEVKLYDSGSSMVAQTKTNSKGIYSFRDIDAGNYFVQFVTPNGYSITKRDATSSCSDSDIDNSGKSRTILFDSDYSCLDAGIYIKPNPKIKIEKSTNGVDADREANAPRVNFGSVVKWSYSVNNIGNVTLKDIAVVDNKEGAVICPSKTLDVGKSMVCSSKTGVAIEGLYKNIAEVHAKFKDDVEVGDSDISHYFGLPKPNPKIKIEKSTNDIDADSESDAVAIDFGLDVEWSYSIKNIGNVRLKDIVVEDDKEGSVSCPKKELEAGKSMQCTLKSAKAKEGLYKNIATVTAKSSIGYSVKDSDSSYYRGSVKPEPKIDIEKSTNDVDADSEADAPKVEFGSVVKWSYRVTNSGNVLLQDIVVDDSKEGTVKCPKTKLKATESMECTLMGKAKEGLYKNIAKVYAKTKHDLKVEDSDISHYIGSTEPKPKIDIEKSTNGVDADKSDDAVEVEYNSEIKWLYKITNRGNTLLKEIVVKDDKEGAVSCPKKELEVGKSMECSLMGKAKEGLYKNVAKVYAKTKNGIEVKDSDPSHYRGSAKPKPKIDIEKSTNGVDADQEVDAPKIDYGAEVKWSYRVTNSGNTKLKNIVVKDDKEGAVSCPSKMLDIGKSMECTPKSAKAKEGLYQNIATVKAKSEDGEEVKDSDSSHYRGSAKPEPKIDIEKSTNGVDADRELDAPKVDFGSVVKWSYKVTNSGNTLLKDIVVEDDKEGSVSCPKKELEVDKSMECTPKSAKAKEGLYKNIVIVKAKSKDGKIVKDIDMSHYRGSAIPKPKIDIEKSTNGVDADQEAQAVAVEYGSMVKWSYVVKNSGNVELKDIVVTDDKEGAVRCPSKTLEAGKSMECTPKSGKAKEGIYKNTAKVKAKSKMGKAVSDSDDSHYKGTNKPEPKIDIEKSTNGVDADREADASKVEYGVEVKWSYRVTNSGNVELKDIVVTDDKEGAIKCPSKTLEAGKSMECSLTSTAKEGLYTNRATVEAKSKNGKSVKDSDMSHYRGSKKPEPKIDIEKSTNGVDADSEADAPKIEYGAEVKWSYRVTNSGNSELKDIVVTDNKEGVVSCPSKTLEAGKSMLCRSKSAKAKEGLYKNIAKVKAKSKDGKSVEDSDPSHYIGSAKPKPSIDIEKFTNGVDADSESEAVSLKFGSKVIWLYKIKNSGDTLLQDIALKDNKEGVVKCPKKELKAGTAMECSLTGRAKEGLYKNIATVKAKSQDGKVVKDSDSSHYRGEEAPSNPPVAVDDSANGKSGEATTIKVLDNDSDTEGDIDPTTVLFGDGSKKMVVDGEGVWMVDDKGVVSFTPEDGFWDSPTAVVYTVADKKAQISNQATITIIYPDSNQASLGDRVWYDIDRDGIQDEDESGLSGIKVELYEGSQKIKETTTDENGTYRFINLMAGEYVVGFVAKEGWSISQKDVKDNSVDSNDSDANSQSGLTDATVLDNAEQDLSVDVGMYQTPRAKIEITKSTNGGKVSNIIEGDTITWSYSIKNSGNVNLGNIELVDDKEGVVACPKDNLTVNEEMLCQKTGVAILGYYKNSATVTSLDPDGASVTASDSSSYTGKDTPIELGSLGDKVWLDIDRDGVQDDLEPGISGVGVTLYDVNKKIVATTQSNQNGNYFFEELEPAEYRVGFAIPKGYRVTKQHQGGDDTKDSDASGNGLTSLVTVIAGESLNSIDIGIYQAPAKLGNRVWYDNNQNGIQDSGEKGIEGIKVKLYNQNDNLIDETTTDNKGQYQFKDLVPNRYFVEFVVPQNYIVSPKDRGDNDSSDSDVDTLGKTAVITLMAGQENSTIDMGLYQTSVKLGDRVWYDSNKNGIQDSGESGIKDVTVELYDSTATLVAQTKTDTSGLYMFDNLIPDDYSVLFIPPAGYIITDRDQGGDDTKDSDVNGVGRSDTITLISGKSDATIDMGLYQRRVSFGNFVWLDTNHNGIQDAGENGVKDVNVTLFGANGAVKSMLTDENGNYIFTDIAPGDYYVEFNQLPVGHIVAPKNEGSDKEKDSDVYKNSDKRFVTEETTLIAGQSDLSWDMGIFKTTCPPSKAVLGDLVWRDINKNGIQDIGESGVAGVKVALYSYDTDEKIGTTTTNESGNYEFSGLAPAEYYLVFDIPTGYFVSAKDQADSDALDSDVNSEGRTEVIILEAGKINSTVDMGIHQKNSTIGDRVWYDENANGIQDTNELGVNGITVTLYQGDTNIETTQTNVSGEYHFTNIKGGKYKILFSGLPTDYIFTPQNQGEDDGLDSDANSNGETQSFILLEAVDNLTIDAGIRRYDIPSSVADTVQGATGDSVTVDVLANDGGGTYALDSSTVRISSSVEGAVVSEDGKTVTVSGEGVWRVNPETGEITFTPEEGFTGDPTPISYTVKDDHGNETGSEVKVNYPPIAKDDSINATPNQIVTIHVLDNDKATSSPLDITTVRLIDLANGSEVERVEVIGQGVWSTNSDGTVIFTPDSGFSLAPTPIEYVVREEAGDVSNHATITIVYPDAVDDTLIVESDERGPFTVDVSINDSDNTIFDTVLIGCETKGVKELKVEGEGLWSVNSNGSITFTPEKGFMGDPTDIKYTIALKSGERSNCATVDIRYRLLAIDDITIMNVGDTTILNIVQNDRGDIVPSTIKLIIPKDATTAMIISEDKKTISVAGEGIWSVNESGVVSFIIEDGFSGTPTPIKYTIEDSSNNVSNEANIIIDRGGKKTIVVGDDTAKADGSNPITIKILENDDGDIDNSTIELIDAEGNRGKKLVVAGEGEWRVNDNGTVTFTPEEGYTGIPTPISYIVYDQDGNMSNRGTITIVGECSCESYESDGIPTLGLFGELFMLLLMGLLGALLIRREELTV